MKDLSIIIPSYNAQAELRQCLESVFAFADGLDFEVLVIDNASGEDNVKMVRAYFPQVNLITNDVNLGFAKACNIGIKTSKGKYYLLLNSDTRVIENTLGALVDFMEKNQAYGIASPLLLDMDGVHIQPSSRRRFPNFWHEFMVVTSLVRRGNLHFLGNGYYIFDYERDRDVDIVPGTCMMIRRTALEEIGLLDEDFFMFGEDIDYCWRMWQAGWKVASIASSRILHVHGGSCKTVAQRRYIQLQHYRSRSILFRKHKGKLYEAVWRLLLSLTSVAKISYHGILSMAKPKAASKDRVLLHHHLDTFRWALAGFLRLT